MNYKNLDFYRRRENFFPKRDNSSFLRRALSKTFKEDIPKNISEVNKEKVMFEEKENNIKYNNDNNPNIINKTNYNKNFFQKYKTQEHNFKTHGTFYNKNKNDKNINNALINRMNKNKKKYNINKYFTSNISEDNVYEEFIINYNPGINPENNYKISNTLDRKKFDMNINIDNNRNKIYNKVSFSNGIYNKNLDNNINEEKRIDYFNNTYHPNHPYQKRKILNFKEKEPIENGMPDKIKKELYFKSNRNNLNNNNNIFRQKYKKAYNYNFNTYNQDINNYDINYNREKNNYNNNTYENNFSINISQNDYMDKNKYINGKYNKNIEKKINDFLTHFSEYCVQYYNNIIKKLFSFLKNYSKKQIKITEPRKTFYKSNYRNYTTKVISTVNTENKIEYNRIPYHKNTDLLIDRIRYNNESKSPDKKNNFEMFRDIKEISKKYELINKRKNRVSYDRNLKKVNDISFNNDSVKRNKEKEKWEKTLEKEREMKKLREKNNQIKNDDTKKNKDKKDLIYTHNNNNNNKSKKLNLNNKNIKNKNQMISIKNIQTKDKKIYVCIKYLNYCTQNQFKSKNNKDNKYKQLKKSETFNITLFANKIRNKIIKDNEKVKDNNTFKKLASIKEEKENKIEMSLSDEGSYN